MQDATHDWKIAGLATLSARFVQGWIFWGGGSRRFIYDPAKLDPYSAEWMGNKLQSAMPGAILGANHIISYLLQHSVLLYASILLFSLAELICGLGLIMGFCTRFCAFITVLISLILMGAFGWQGTTCMDEWTMAVATLSLGFTLTLTGSPVYSVDHWLRHRHSRFAARPWFSYIASGPLPITFFKDTALVFCIFTILFTTVTYNYYRGAILSKYHSGPVSAGQHHLTLTSGTLKSDGSLHFLMYVDGGTPAVPASIIRMELLNPQKKIIETWEGAALSALSLSNIRNVYPYNLIAPGFYGLDAPVSAKADIVLPSQNPKLHLVGRGYSLVIYTISGLRFEVGLAGVTPMLSASSI